ncbi:MAG: L,D-transpeptidase [Acidobacteria bacterium]|nr:MAG: L,D-transpeptidase [Acidobacteriota bacterium]
MSQRGTLLALAAALAAGALLTAASLAAVTTRMLPQAASARARGSPPAFAGDPRSVGATGKLEKEVARLEAARKKLASKISKLQPQGIWVLVDTGSNRICLMDGETVLREAVCSTGSGRVLEDPQSERKWIFNTPRGEFEVRGKKTNPIWIKPDWEFIEEGKPLPTSFKERVEEDMLGDYALDIGDGYLIHGTLYKRALGMSVTHGCVRVGDDDLEVIYKAVRIGSRVYII